MPLFYPVLVFLFSCCCWWVSHSCIVVVAFCSDLFFSFFVVVGIIDFSPLPLVFLVFSSLIACYDAKSRHWRRQNVFQLASYLPSIRNNYCSCSFQTSFTCLSSSTDRSSNRSLSWKSIPSATTLQREAVVILLPILSARGIQTDTFGIDMYRQFILLLLALRSMTPSWMITHPIHCEINLMEVFINESERKSRPPSHWLIQ